MARVRTFLLILATCGALHAPGAMALGVGDITLHSALDQPLVADIRLLETGDLDSNDIKVGLAPEEAYARSGVERVAFLTDLRFTPILRNGEARIHVVSTRPVREPYLNFIIEVVRPNGRLLREYTVLLDPIDPAWRGPGAVAASEKAPRIQAKPETRASRADVAPKAAPPAREGKHYTVAPGDNLWRIAKRFAGPGAAQGEMQDGILALNPQAFVGGDSHRLKVGERLLLPDSAVEASTLSQDRHAAPVAETMGAPATVASADEAMNPARMAEVQRRVEQQLAESEQERLQLRKDILELQLKLEQLQQQVARKDQQVGDLQARLAERPAANDAASGVPGTSPSLEPAPASVPEATQPTAVAPAPAAPASEPRDADETGWWRNALVLLAVGLLALLILALLVLRRRRRPVRRPSEPVPTAPPETPVVEALSVRPHEPEAPISPEATIVRSPVPPRSPWVGSDALEGANIYIAYGRFGEARTALHEAIEREPQRLDLRLRLLEVLGELGDGPGFAEQDALIIERGGDPQSLAPIKARYSRLGAAAPVEERPEPFDDVLLTLDADEGASGKVAEPENDDFQLNLDDLSLEADWDLVSPFEPATPARKISERAAAEEAAAAFDAQFASPLQALPEVRELDREQHPGDFDAFDLFDDVAPGAPTRLDPLDDLPGRPEEPLDMSLDDLAGNREHLSKLNQALAYIEQGDMESACGILNEVISEGDDRERREARELLARIA